MGELAGQKVSTTVLGNGRTPFMFRPDLSVVRLTMGNGTCTLKDSQSV